MRVVYSRVAVKAINSFDKSVKQRIKTGIEGLLEVPPKGDIKQMQGTHLNDEEILLIKDIGSRGDIYK